MRTEIKRRTFESEKYAKDSLKRAKLNENVLTSEYMHSYKYTLFVYYFETKERNAYISTRSFRTKKEAEVEMESFKILVE